jgi:hypothetical protein
MKPMVLVLAMSIIAAILLTGCMEPESSIGIIDRIQDERVAGLLGSSGGMRVYFTDGRSFHCSSVLDNPVPSGEMARVTRADFNQCLIERWSGKQ